MIMLYHWPLSEIANNDNIAAMVLWYHYAENDNVAIIIIDRIL